MLLTKAEINLLEKACSGAVDAPAVLPLPPKTLDIGKLVLAYHKRVEELEEQVEDLKGTLEELRE